MNKACSSGNFLDRQTARTQKIDGPRDALSEDELVRRHSGRSGEGATEMERTKLRRARKVC